MPRLDKTGPNGKGPKTGRGLGKCPPTPTKKVHVIQADLNLPVRTKNQAGLRLKDAPEMGTYREGGDNVASLIFLYKGEKFDAYFIDITICSNWIDMDNTYH